MRARDTRRGERASRVPAAGRKDVAAMLRREDGARYCEHHESVPGKSLSGVRKRFHELHLREMHVSAERVFDPDDDSATPSTAAGSHFAPMALQASPLRWS